MGRMPHGKDIIHVLRDFCQDNDIAMAVFGVTGAVSLFTIGTFDQKQQVYVTTRNKRPMEIAACTGNIIYHEKWHVHAQIILADQSGKTSGGRLFSDTLLFAGELQLMELLGPCASRQYDPDSGRMLLVTNNLEKE
ncbi:MAG: DUF296 domain-containing protein [Desulfobacterales bacterium]